MRICLYTESALPLVGGQEIVVDHLAREFIALGHDVVVLAAKHRGRAVLRDHELPYKVVRHPRFISTHRMVSWYRWYVERLRRRFPFDILHCHSVQPTGYVAACGRNLTNVRVVITSHCGEICPDSQLLRKPGAYDRCRQALVRADAAVAISEFADQCLRDVGPEHQTIERIINGVEYARFAAPVPRTTKIDPALAQAPYFLFLGRIVHRKGVDLAIEAFDRAAPRIESQLVIAGDGLELASMRLLAQRLGIDRRVHFVGRVGGNDKIWLLQNCIATVMPSRVWEGCPLVALESFAAGRPVIATRTAGLQELVTPEFNGFLVAPDSTAELACALVEAAGNTETTNRLGEQAQRFAREHDWTAVARRYLNLFERLLAEPGLDRKPNQAA